MSTPFFAAPGMGPLARWSRRDRKRFNEAKKNLLVYGTGSDGPRRAGRFTGKIDRRPMEGAVRVAPRRRPNSCDARVRTPATLLRERRTAARQALLSPPSRPHGCPVPPRRDVGHGCHGPVDCCAPCRGDAYIRNEHSSVSDRPEPKERRVVETTVAAFLQKRGVAPWLTSD